MNTSNFSCPLCGRYFSRADAKNLVWGGWVDCTCKNGGNLSLNTVVTNPSELGRSFYVAKNVKAAAWHHYTLRENWLEDVTKAGVWVHVGSPASVDAMRRFRLEGARRSQAPRYVFTVGLVAPVVAMGVTEDHNDWPDRVDDHAVNGTTYGPKVNVVRYLNRYEAPGEVSLLVKPSALKILRRHTLPGLTPKTPVG